MDSLPLLVSTMQFNINFLSYTFVFLDIKIGASLPSSHISGILQFKLINSKFVLTFSFKAPGVISASPMARKLALENGIDVTKIKGNYN